MYIPAKSQFRLTKSDFKLLVVLDLSGWMILPGFNVIAVFTKPT